MPSDLSGQLPPFDPAAKAPNSNINAYDPDATPVALPTWLPDAAHRDARLAKIADAETNGEYGTLDGSHPCHDERTAGCWPSDKLHYGGQSDHEAIGPDGFARSGGTKR